jgi:hypothetical protein
VRSVYEREAALIADQTHERAIMFHVGRHVAAQADAWGDVWSVDLEYNRLHHSEREVVTKTVEGTPWYRGGLVVPDLIVHDRSRSSREANLLVVEAKLRPSRADRALDAAKLAAYMEVLDYQYAAFLEFPGGMGTPRWMWFTHGSAAIEFASLAANGQLPPAMW